MTKQDPALSQDFIAQKRSLTVFCENFAQIAKESISFVLNLHRVLTIFNKQPEDDQNYAYIQLKEQND